jgi:hypothetical protein
VNGLDTGQAGTPLSVSNSGSGGSPFDSILAPATSPIVFDARDATGPGGGLSALHESGKGEPAFYDWEDSLAWRTTYWGRLYLRFNEYPTKDLRIIRAKDGSDTTFAIVLNDDGQLRVLDDKKHTIGTLQAKVELGGWFRLEWMVDHRTGTAELRFFNDPGTTPSGSLRITGRDLGSRTTRVSIGRVETESIGTRFWTDVPSLSVLGWLGPDA